MATKVAKFEVLRFEGDKSVMGEIFELYRLAGQVSNRAYKLWLLWHESNGTREKIQKYLATFPPKDKRPKGWKPETQLGVNCIPKSTDLKNGEKSIGSRLTESFPNMASETVDLLWNVIQKKIVKMKSVRGTLPGWYSVLLDAQGMPSFLKGVPIPFRPKSCKLIPPSTDKDDWKVSVSVGRIPPVSGKKVGKSKEYTFYLKTRTKQARCYASLLKRITDGDPKVKMNIGSSLNYRETEGHWVFLLNYDLEEPFFFELDRMKTATLKAGDDHAFSLLMPDGYDYWIRKKTHFVAQVRRQIIMQRRSRQNNYRHAASSTKGHGRRRATQAWEAKLHQKWLNFQDTFNKQLAAEIAKYLKERGIGTLVYLQPNGEEGNRKFLASEGCEEYQQNRGWTWYELGTRLSFACERNGIKVIVQKEVYERDKQQRMEKENIEEYAPVSQGI